MPPVNVRDVAALAGVSVGTVSNVLNRPEKVNETTIQRVQDAIDSLGFVRNDAARQLRAGRSRAIGLIVLDASNPFFTDIARGAEGAAQDLGIAVLTGNSDQDPVREQRYLDLFEEQRVRGILLSPVGELSARLERIRSRGVPVVLVDRRADLEGFSSVSVDDVRGGGLAVDHLLELGRRRIAFVGGPLDLQQVADRLEGARLSVASVPGATLEVVEIPQLTVEHGRRAGERLRARSSDELPDAVFAANDLVAVGILQAFMLTGAVSVPQQVALVGYDDIAFANAAVVPITSIRQPSELMGRTAIELVERELDDPDGAVREHVVFPPELIVRASTVGAMPPA
jgi:LacI family transcriptional regulator